MSSGRSSTFTKLPQTPLDLLKLHLLLLELLLLAVDLLLLLLVELPHSHLWALKCVVGIEKAGVSAKIVEVG